jgi:hypothetical protein
VSGWNPLARHVLDVLLERHPEWADYADERKGDLVLVVPAPPGSRAKALVVQTQEGQDIWIRFAPRHAFYSVDTDEELHQVIDALLSDRAAFLMITNGDEWVETTLLAAGQEPVLTAGQVADVVSWSGRHDRLVTPAPVPETRH